MLAAQAVVEVNSAMVSSRLSMKVIRVSGDFSIRSAHTQQGPQSQSAPSSAAAAAAGIVNLDHQALAYAVSAPLPSTRVRANMAGATPIPAHPPSVPPPPPPSHSLNRDRPSGAQARGTAAC